MSNPQLAKDVHRFDDPSSVEYRVMMPSNESSSESGVLSVGSLVSVIGDEEFFGALWNLTEEEENEVFTEDSYAELMDVYFTVSLETSWLFPSIREFVMVERGE